MFDTSDPLRVEYLDGHEWKLLEDFCYFDEEGAPGETDGTFIDVPAGFVTDFASIPRVLWNILPPTGPYGKAAVIHDYLYWTGKAEGRPIPKSYADGVFYRAMRELGVGFLRARSMWLAVRLFGRGIWHEDAR
jgi:hypothetical protein